MEIRKSLETNFLICKICQQSFRNPKVLACMHTFCKQCLENLLQCDKLDAAKKRREIEKQYSSGYSSTSSISDYKGRWSKKFKSTNHPSETGYFEASSYLKHRFSEDEIQCPVCNKRTTLPMSGVYGLPEDQLASKLAIIVGKIPNYPICDVCSNGHKARSESECISLAQLDMCKKPNCPPSWTDGDEDNTSDFQTTEDEEDSQFQLSKRNFGFKSNIPQPIKYSYPANNSVSEDKNDLRLLRIISPQTCKEPDEAVAACLDCAKRLCLNCHLNHLKISVTADHVIVSLDQLERLYCGRHSNELKRFFCITCGELICLVCTFETSSSDLISDSSADSNQSFGHSDHEVLSIRQALISLKNCIYNTINECEKKTEKLDDLLVAIESCKDYVANLKQDINEAAEYQIQRINTDRQKLFQELDDDIGVQADLLALQCETIHSSITSWEELRTEQIKIESLESLHPIGALTEMTLVKDQCLGCFDVLNASVPQSCDWQKFINELEKIPVQDIVSKNYDDGFQSTIIDTPMMNAPKFKKRVRFQDSYDGFSFSYRTYWKNRLGTFLGGNNVNLGRRVTPKQLASEAAIRSEKILTKAIQVSPTDINGKCLTRIKDAQRHRAIQVNLSLANSTEFGIQTSSINELITPTIKVQKIDSGTQYQNSDINTPISFFRSSKKIVVLS